MMTLAVMMMMTAMQNDKRSDSSTTQLSAAGEEEKIMENDVTVVDPNFVDHLNARRTSTNPEFHFLHPPIVATNAIQAPYHNHMQNINDDNKQLLDQHKIIDEGVDSFPNFSRYGSRSLLKKFLTRAVYEELKDRTTIHGVTLEDIIRGGVSLPYGADPPHGKAGIYAGDAESYQVFSKLLLPVIIATHHKATPPSRVRSLQRFQTNLNPGGLVTQRLDENGSYILYTRMRLARSLRGFRFAPCITRAERRYIERLFMECVQDLQKEYPDGKYVSIMDMTNQQHSDLVRRQLLFPNPDEYKISAGLGRDWPDARGVYLDTWSIDTNTPNLIVWCNNKDHISIISNTKGGDVQGVFQRLSHAAQTLESSLRRRGHSFAEDSRLGYLNTSPADIGPALRASVCIKLVRLGRHKGFEELLQRLGLEARSPAYYSRVAATTGERYTGIFDIGNAESTYTTRFPWIHCICIC
jgi:creatine kinase